MITRHLGKRLYVLADGRLEHAETVEAMAHLETCGECSTAWDEALRARLALQTSGSGIDMRFTQRLLDRERIAEIAGAEPRRHAKAARGIRPHVLRATITSSAALLVVLSTLYVMGEPQKVGLESFAADSNGGTHTVAMVQEPEDAMAGLASWSSPAWEGTSIVPLSAAVFDDDGVAVLRATVVFGVQQMVVTERRGQLVLQPGDPVALANVESRNVYVVEGIHVSVVFESAGSVVMIDCFCPLETALDAAEEFPEGERPGVLERLGSGAGEVADAVLGG